MGRGLNFCITARLHVLSLQSWLLDDLSQLQYGGKRLTSIIYVSQPLSLSRVVIPREEVCTRAWCPRRPSLNWLNSLSLDPCTSPSSHGEDTRSKQLLHIPDGRARQMSKENQRERQGKVYEAAFANLNVNLSILSSKTECSWWNSWPCPVCSCPASLPFSLCPSAALSLSLSLSLSATAQCVDSVSCLL